MKSQRARILAACLTCLISISESHSSKHLDLSAGFTPSKSTVGFAYGNESNEITVGLKNNPLAPLLNTDKVFQPGISYNHKIHPNGLYASVTYAPIFTQIQQYNGFFVESISTRSPIVGPYYFMKDGWNSGEVFIGLGKTFQGKHLGFTLDGNLITPVTSDLAQSWSYWIGFGFSYRIKLD